MDWSSLFKKCTPTREKKRQLKSAKWPGHVLPPIVPNIDEVEIKIAHPDAATSAREASKLLFRETQAREIKIIPSTEVYNFCVEPTPFNLAALNNNPKASQETAGCSEWKTTASTTEKYDFTAEAMPMYDSLIFAEQKSVLLPFKEPATQEHAHPLELRVSDDGTWSVSYPPVSANG